MGTTASPKVQSDVTERFRSVRQRTMELCNPLTPEDMMVQSCPEASPAKWHLAHTALVFRIVHFELVSTGIQAVQQGFSVAVQQLLPEFCGVSGEAAEGVVFAAGAG